MKNATNCLRDSKKGCNFATELKKKLKDMKGLNLICSIIIIRLPEVAGSDEACV